MDRQTQSLIEAIESLPPGTLKLFRATEDNPDVETSIKNMEELAGRVLHARNAGCLIEVISLRIQYLDLWLRIYFVNTSHPPMRREREFWRLLRQCFEIGLNKKLYDKLLAFNTHRVKAIHGYLIGAIMYDKLASVVSKSNGLSKEVTKFIIENSGEIVTKDFSNQHHNRGDFVFYVPSLLAGLEKHLI